MSAQSASFVKTWDNDDEGFVENKGQLYNPVSGQAENLSGVRYYGRQGRVNIYCYSNKISFVFAHIEYADSTVADTKDASALLKKARGAKMSFSRMEMQFTGPEALIFIQPEDVQKQVNNYYLPSCPGGLLSVKPYARLTYKNMYPGIDMELLWQNQAVKYQFVIHPGADLNNIRIKWTGDCISQKSDNGAIVHTGGLGYISEEAPYTYIQGGAPVKCSYKINKEGITTFKTEKYNTNATLVIDPSIKWSTYYGNTGNDGFWAISLDSSQKYIYACGTTTSTSGIATSGAFQSTIGGGFYGDAIVAKFDTSGNRIWATYYGGNDMDELLTIKTKGNESIYAAGLTSSTSGISSSGAYQTLYGGGATDAILLKFDSSGKRIWGTYFGGDSGDNVISLSIAKNNTIFALGSSYSANKIATSGAFQTSNFGNSDLFLASFNSAGQRIWATYYGTSGRDLPYSSVIDSLNCLYICASSPNAASLATKGAFCSTCISGASSPCGIIAKFNSAGNPAWCTVFPNTPAAIKLSAKNKYLYFYGHSDGNSLISSTNSYQSNLAGQIDTYLEKFDSSGKRVWGTYYGTKDVELANDLAIDKFDNLYISGRVYGSTSTGLASNGAFQTSNGGSYDGFVAIFDSTGVRKWGSYFGGPKDESVNSICPDNHFYFYISGGTGSSKGIATSGAFQSSLIGNSDAYIAKIGGCPIPLVKGPDSLCAASTVKYFTQWHDGSSYKWVVKKGAVLSINTDSITIRWDTSGTGTVTVIESTALGCSDTSSKNIRIFPKPKADFSMREHCAKSSTFFNDSSKSNGASVSSYAWNFGNSATSKAKDTSYIYTLPGVYHVTHTLITSKGCIDSISKPFIIYGLPKAVAGLYTVICKGDSVTLGALPASGHSYLWSSDDKTVSGSASAISVRPQQTTVYHLFEKNDSTGCTNNDTVTVAVNSVQKDKIKGDTLLCRYKTAIYAIAVHNGYTWKWETTGGKINGKDNLDSVSVTWNDTLVRQVKVKITSNLMCTDSVVQSIYVLPLPRASVSTDTAVCLYASADIKAPQNKAYKYTWQVSHGDIYAGAGSNNISANWNTVGNGFVYLRVTDAAGCTDSVIKHITINPLPQLSAGKSQTLCPGDSISIGTAVSAGVSYLWSSIPAGFSSSNASAVVKPVINTAYVLTGMQTSTGCIQKDTVFIGVNPLPIVNTGPSKSICPGDTIIIGDVAVPDYEYQWTSVPQGFSAVTANTRVSPYASTIFKLAVKNKSGCTKIDSVSIKVNPAPQIKISGNSNICAGTAVTLKAVSSPGCQYKWFASPPVNTGNDSIFMITPRAATTVLLTAKYTATGCKSWDSLEINTLPVPSFQINGTDKYCSIPQFGYFYVPTASATSYKWQCLPGKISGQDNKNSLFIEWRDTGLARVWLTETNNYGCSAADTMMVRCVAPQGKLFSIHGQCVSDTINFIDSCPFGKKFLWGFGNGDSSFLKDPFSIYTIPGLYHIREIISDKYGCSDTFSRNLNIFDKPAISFKIKQDTGFLFNFSADDTAKNRYTWLAGHDTFKVKTFSLYLKNADNPFPVHLHVASPEGCTALLDTMLQISYKGNTDSISIFPNPFSNHIYVFFRISGITDFRFILFDMLGRQVTAPVLWSSVPGIYQKEPEIPYKKLSAGIYIAVLQVNDKTIIKKLVKAQ